jgi:hypothetical protein
MSSTVSAHAPVFPPGTEYSGNTLLSVIISFTVLEIIFVGLRYVAQWIGRKPRGLDDWLVLPGLLLCIGVNINAFCEPILCLCLLSSLTRCLDGLKLGSVGYHIGVVEKYDPESLISWAKVLVATPILYSAACCFPKVVILTLYLRIFTQRSYRIACYVLMFIVVTLAFSDIISGLTVCQPIAYMWDKTIPGGHCIDIVSFYRWGTLPNAITDLMMLILPLPVVWALHTTKRVKIGLTITFLTGSM